MGLIIKNLSKSFDGKVIFDNFSYTFSDKGIYAIIGKSGVGKTTLLRMIAGLDTKFRGQIIGGGVKNTSFSFQEYRLFPQLTAIDNVILANYPSKTADAEYEAKETLLRLGFEENDLYLYPDQLSGGMKQRASLARALLRKSEILLLDEPTKELNAELSATVRQIMREESTRRLVIFVTHNTADIDDVGAQRLSLAGADA